MLRVIRKLPVTFLALVAGSTVCAAFGAAFLADYRDFFGPIPLWLRFPFHPGMFSFYVVGGITASPMLAYTAFVAGTVLVYGMLGLACDLAWSYLRCISNWMKNSA